MPRAKIKPVQELRKIISRLKCEGKRIVFTNGCFDLLHYGHVKYLADAKKKGDILIVAINSDASVKRIKGDKRPIINEKDRLKTVASLVSVDYVVLFKEDTPLKLIKLLRPDILVKGADWSKNNIVGKDYVLSYGGRVSTVRLVKGYSTTLLIKKIKKIGFR
ncbi:MAG: D-glycero-beta-D-manno-heptose 1-phosphate adenylyltransferase [Candidatus Omnitrophica bacterium]|nr:D-glycero-beta-D-manno-heptose 1-phosphate adenylyltransferase [Candidatus Omnitrophota bacterium]MDD5238587.1 D-glycero-beta-D-manno-heptose 1-phosphate adenylyltransferase [Candidatus Omnitrophota bacterium]